MPKSSTDTLHAERPQPPRGARSAASTSSMHAVSVISSIEVGGLEPGSPSAASTCADAARVGAAAGADTFTETPDAAGRLAARQAAACAQAGRSTQSPIGTISPVSSAMRDELAGRHAGRGRGGPSAAAPRRRRSARWRGRRWAGSRARSSPRSRARRSSLLELAAGADDALAHALVEDGDPVAALLLGPVHGGVGVAQQVLGGRRPSLGDGHARRSPVTKSSSPLDQERLVERPRRSRCGDLEAPCRRSTSSGRARRTRRRRTGRRCRRAAHAVAQPLGDRASSSSSPALWPSVSLTSLNRSRSRNSTAAGRPSASVRESVSASAARFSIPVSTSWVARWRRSTSRFRRSASISLKAPAISPSSAGPSTGAHTPVLAPAGVADGGGDAPHRSGQPPVQEQAEPGDEEGGQATEAEGPAKLLPGGRGHRAGRDAHDEVVAVAPGHFDREAGVAVEAGHFVTGGRQGPVQAAALA